MGLLINGVWQDSWYDTSHSKGVFQRESSQFRQAIAKDHSTLFPAEKDRYHLYISLACPWAHRTLIFRQLKNLQDYISVSVVHPYMLENGWEFKADIEDTTGDTLYGLNYLYELYRKADKNYTGRVTVPVLWDKKNQTIVSNESADIIRQFNSAFNHLTHDQQDFYPSHLATDIDEINEKIYHTVNNGVYKCGFATTQQAYEQAYQELFTTLDYLEGHLATHQFLVGNQLTEADWRLFTTLIRFDAVYYSHFKTNKQRVSDYTALSHYLQRLYKHPKIKETVNINHIKKHYYYSHKNINPTQIIPTGPILEFL